MHNSEKYDDVFVKVFGVLPEKLENLKYQDIPKWDSIGHMSLITVLEDTFEISLDTDDIIDFDSYAAGKQILSKYDIYL